MNFIALHYFTLLFYTVLFRCYSCPLVSTLSILFYSILLFTSLYVLKHSWWWWWCGVTDSNTIPFCLTLFNSGLWELWIATEKSFDRLCKLQFCMFSSQTIAVHSWHTEADTAGSQIWTKKMFINYHSANWIKLFQIPIIQKHQQSIS